jgi:hypothetical protein
MGRLIDADALIEEMVKVPGNQWNTKTFGKALEKVPTVEPKLGWISVKDRLPKSMANQVLVWLKHNDLVGYIGFGHYEKYKGQEIWFDLEGNAAFSVRGYTVTHWMPLPEPPKEEDE